MEEDRGIVECLEERLAPWESALESVDPEIRREFEDYLVRGPASQPADPCPVEEAFVSDWGERMGRFEEAEREEEAAGRLLSEAYPALLFPVGNAIADREDYQLATRRGVFPPAQVGEGSQDSRRFSIILAKTPVGRIPIVEAPGRSDFEWLLRCLSKNNRADEIPQTQGAAFLSGLVNWGRLNRFRKQWEMEHPLGGWHSEWRRIVADKASQFRDRLIVVTSGSYGGIPAEKVSALPRDWAENSLRIRLEHECVHYCFFRWRGFVSGTLSEEIVSDFVALREVLGKVSADCLETVLGLDRDLEERPRFMNYVPERLEPLAEVFRGLALQSCKELIDRFDGAWDKDEAIRLLESCSLGRGFS